MTFSKILQWNAQAIDVNDRVPLPLELQSDRELLTVRKVAVKVKTEQTTNRIDSLSQTLHLRTCGLPKLGPKLGFIYLKKSAVHVGHGPPLLDLSKREPSSGSCLSDRLTQLLCWLATPRCLLFVHFFDFFALKFEPTSDDLFIFRTLTANVSQNFLFAKSVDNSWALLLTNS